MSELVEIKKSDAMAVFTKRENIEPLLKQIEDVALKEVFDVNTDKGRKAIASMAYKVAQSKTYIEGFGKDLAAELKELPKLVDANRKYVRDFLDTLKDKVRQPLTEYEAEQERIRIKAEIEIYHEQALKDHIEWEEVQKKKKIEQEKARLEYEERIKQEAEERARKQAESAIQYEKIRHERELKLAEEKHQRELLQAKMKAEAELKQKELNERLERERAEFERRTAEHTNMVEETIKNDFIAIGLNEKQAFFILNAIKNEKINYLKIDY